MTEKINIKKDETNKYVSESNTLGSCLSSSTHRMKLSSSNSQKPKHHRKFPCRCLSPHHH